MHEVLVNRLGGLSLPRKSVVRLTVRPDMTLDVYRGRKTTMQQQQIQGIWVHQEVPSRDYSPVTSVARFRHLRHHIKQTTKEYLQSLKKYGSLCPPPHHHHYHMGLGWENVFSADPVGVHVGIVGSGLQSAS